MVLFVKCIKIRLCRTLTESKLEAFMLMAIENDVLNKVNNDEIIKILKSKSTLLLNNLSH